MPKSKGYKEIIFHFCTFQIEIYTEKDPFYEWTFFLFTNKGERKMKKDTNSYSLIFSIIESFSCFFFHKTSVLVSLTHSFSFGCCIDDIMLILNNNGSIKELLFLCPFYFYFYSTTILHFKMGSNREHY